MDRFAKIIGMSWALLIGGQCLSAFGQEISSGAITIRLPESEQASTSSQIVARFEVNGCTGILPQAVRINPQNQTLDLAYTISSVDFSGGLECLFARYQDVPVGPVYLEGEYDFNFYNNAGELGSDFFNSENLVGTLNLEVKSAVSFANPETPIDGSTQSGIGVIRGWACDARTVAVSFDHLPPLELAYGTAREDTRGVCGDVNNGYGAVFAFGSLGNGTHTMTTWIDGAFRDRVEFEANGLPDPFTEGLSAEYELPDFPNEGDRVIIRWSQADQNFIIVDHSE